MKKLLTFFLTFILLFFNFIPTAADTFSELTSPVILVYDTDSETVLYAKQADEKRAVASLTKMMTAIVAIEEIKDLNAKVTVKSAMLAGVPWDASIAGFKAGETLTYKDLLHGLLLPSGADAADILAISLCGSVASFVEKMNAKAQELNLKQTHFVNTTGYDAKNHYSSAHDMLKLLQYALNNPTFKTIFSTKSYVTTSGVKLKSTILHYVKNYGYDAERIAGCKTGYTGKAGFCIVAAFNSNEHQILTVILGDAKTMRRRYNVIDLYKIIDYLDHSYADRNVLQEEVLYTLPVKLAKITSYPIIFNDIAFYLPEDYKREDFTIGYNGIEELTYKDQPGERLGTLRITYQGQQSVERIVYLNQQIKADFAKIVYYYRYPLLITLSLALALLLSLWLYLNRKRFPQKKVYHCKHAKR